MVTETFPTKRGAVWWANHIKKKGYKVSIHKHKNISSTWWTVESVKRKRKRKYRKHKWGMHQVGGVK